MKKLNLQWLLWMLLFGALKMQANNIQITNVKIAEDNPAAGYAMVEFDLSWENSWRTTLAPDNWDAAWIFVKYRENGGAWQHAWLDNTGHLPGSGTGAEMETGLKDDKQAFHPTTNPGIGMMVYRSAVGAGTFAASKMQLRWNYNANGVPAGAVVELRVFGIEMVLARGGEFWLGDGSGVGGSGTFRQVESSAPFKVTAAGGTLRAEINNSGDWSQLQGAGVWVDGDGGISRSAATETDMNPDYPTGYRGFYLMKYEVSQGQYRDFLNTLTREQQMQRVRTIISGTSVTNRYVMSGESNADGGNGLRCDASLPATGPIEIFCDLDGDGEKNESNDGEWIACNFVSARDGWAFMDWSGLRPMTELEFEKACRGPNEPVSGEYAWGTATIATQTYAITDRGTAQEQIVWNYSATGGNANYFYNASPFLPLRTGIFAANALNTGRISAGAGYFGAMELSGNLLERTVRPTPPADNFTGLHGDGAITQQGNADVWIIDSWIATSNRGGSFSTLDERLKVSDRSAGNIAGRDWDTTFRACRSVPPGRPGY
jgi:formylglycine-generating enzyme required for sulfatase activity